LSPSINFGVSGALGGFQLGYNRQFNQVWLAGLDTDFVNRPTSF